jgi:hypothetical protein
MGNECRKPINLNSATDNLNIVSFFKESLDPSELTEGKLVNPIKTFRTHRAPMSKPCFITNPNTKVDHKGILKPTVLKFPVKKNPLASASFSHTLKNHVKQCSISLEASRFILEQKKSMWDKYEVVANLGKGAFGEVQLIRNKDTKVQRALKSINKSNCQTTDNFIEEIKILKELVTLI